MVAVVSGGGIVVGEVDVGMEVGAVAGVEMC